MSAFPYLTQAVRDLAWACFAPPLLHIEQLAYDGQNLAACGLDLTPGRQRWLAQLDSEPRPLLEQLARDDNHRLGIYFERLWHFFLQADPAVELIAHNLPLRERGRTLGEFDIIYWCHERQRHFHLELAVKYFLGYRRSTTCEPASHWNEWLGPNPDDRLDLKIDQLLQRQTRLADHPLAREQLQGMGIEDLAREVAFKGYLFRSGEDPLPPPFGFNCALPLSRWLPLRALESCLDELQAAHFLPLPRARWLTPVQAGKDEEFIDRAGLAHRLQSALASGGRAQLIAAVDTAGAETSRFFVTADDWPARRDKTTITLEDA
ncbi:MAG: DUF1853 family protein [Gammaproteobacteria bacterium]|nr:DUF1853 family protein [Gammaproteobacteria bacterium]MDH5172668.1 DUF1853 family protein [Gammaproteobacteria bacterium]